MNDATLKKLHQTEVEILDEIVRLCREHGLTYYLIGGTLLGAVRHKGYIPWDDDLDIAMPRKDYEKFLDIAETGLGPEYYTHSYKNDENYWLAFAKVKKKKTLFLEPYNAGLGHDTGRLGIYVDVFPLDDAKKEAGFQRVQKRIVDGVFAMLIIKRKESRERKSILKRVISSLFTKKTLQRLINRVMSFRNGENRPYYVSFGSQYGIVKQTIAKSRYYPPVKLEFEGKEYDVMNDWDYFLRRIYGADYMKLPPPEKRVTHDPARLSFNTDGPDEEL